MNLLEEDIERFLELLLRYNLKFILVGGLAVNFHGYSRSTGDVDIWIKDTLENRKNLILALQKYGIKGGEVFESIPLIAGYSEIMLDSGIYVDMMSELQFIKQSEFDECFEMSDYYEISETMKIPVLHINKLISEKEKSKRGKDIEDANVLKKIISKKNE